MDDFNPYEILGLNNTASQTDIRAAYKKLALRYHPDKPEGNEFTFKRIHQAYQILSDPFRKHVYDSKHNSNTNDSNTKILEEFFANVVNVLHDKLKEKLNSKINTTSQNGEESKKEAEHDMKAMNIVVDVDLQEVYNAEVKKILIKVCTGGVEEIKPFYVSLNNYQSVYCFDGKGDNGTDLNIKLNIVSKLMPHIQQDNVLSLYNLYIQTELSLFEYYYGVNKIIGYFDEDIVLKLEPFANRPDNFVHIIHNKGLPYINADDEHIRGDLYIHFELKLPDISENELAVYKPVLKTLFHVKNE